jgi:hypothetical protein
MANIWHNFPSAGKMCQSPALHFRESAGNAVFARFGTGLAEYQATAFGVTPMTTAPFFSTRLGRAAWSALPRCWR